MTTVTALLSIFGGLAGLVALVSTARAYSRASYAKATIELQSTRIETLQGALEDERRKLEEETKSRGVLQKRVEAIEIENQALRNALGGKADLAALIELVNGQHAAVLELILERHKQVMSGIGDIARMLGDRRQPPGL